VYLIPSYNTTGLPLKRPRVLFESICSDDLDKYHVLVDVAEDGVVCEEVPLYDVQLDLPIGSSRISGIEETRLMSKLIPPHVVVRYVDVEVRMKWAFAGLSV
jgi:hypothetical protein